ncbi:MAG: bifunctional UDP-N-acetylglucosamine diphosphorylase/glucosamine-1-phosphate N-acetyltransferase GlmU [Firmicutes bacterium]|nr:bifunctional UDP-N-acetylglucosamine diphosphorylase/glucosamine-1-phosphate N-acetyltransferase GlmU [Bacillota bacterium]
MNIAAVVLAAGKGTRMKSALPKMLHPVCGRPMVTQVVGILQEAGIHRIIVVVGPNEVADRLGDQIEFVTQAEPLGTGHAVLQAEEALKGHNGPVVVVHGDTPLYLPDTIKELVRYHQAAGATGTVLTVDVEDPTGYGRIIRDRDGSFVKIVEQKDATDEEAKTKEINSGTYVFAREPLFAALHQIKPQNVQKEYYLTDVLAILRRERHKVDIYKHGDAEEALGINNRAQLAVAEGILRDRIRKAWMLAGVTMLDPNTVYIDAEAKLAEDVVILPFTFIEGNSRIAKGSVIGPFARLKDAHLGENVTVTQATVMASSIGAGAVVGPYSYIRPHCHIGAGARIGGFCEIKNTVIGSNSKVPHLSYVGDTDVGSDVNIGAGTITCNYDGAEKHRTIIEDRAFIGSNCNLVAPVVIGSDSYLGAGSTITGNVPPGALGVARSRQRNIPDWAGKWGKKQSEEEESR